jgi:hypothetical protein
MPAPEIMHSGERLYSLRGRYLFIATCVCLLLLAAAVIANRYTGTASNKNTQSLALRDKVTETIGDIRNSILKADIALNATLISPSEEYESGIVDNLDSAKRRMTTLLATPAIETAGLEQGVGPTVVR